LEETPLIKVTVMGCTRPVFKEIVLSLTIEGPSVQVSYGNVSSVFIDPGVRVEIPELILLDLENIGISSLPNMIKNSDRPVKTPIVILADVDIDPKLLISALDAGIADYIFKPIKQAYLLDTVRQFKQEVDLVNRVGDYSHDPRRIVDCG
jgi:DNA-binding response OmpR family regulator